jgi:hypothetical protein
MGAVGIDHDPADLAVKVCDLGGTQGSYTYPDATELRVTADGEVMVAAFDCGRWRCSVWPTSLACPLGLPLSPGTSQWHKIEHRMCSDIRMNWRGQPLASHEIIVN